MHEELRIEGRISDGIAFITLEGYINMETSDELMNQIADMIYNKDCRKFIFDVEKLEYVSSAGIGLFMELYDKNVDYGGKICFINLKPEIKRVFELVGFMQYFGDLKTADEAVKYVG